MPSTIQRMDRLCGALAELPESLDRAFSTVQSLSSLSMEEGRINGIEKAINAIGALRETTPANYSEAERRARIQALIDALVAVKNCIGKRP